MVRTIAKAFHEEMNATLKALFAKYNLTRKSSHVTYGENFLKISINCEELEADGTHKSDPATESALRYTLTDCGVKNIPAVIVGAKFKMGLHGNTIYTITGFNSRAPKYPIEIEAEDGKKYKHTGRGIRFI